MDGAEWVSASLVVIGWVNAGGMPCLQSDSAGGGAGLAWA